MLPETVTPHRATAVGSAIPAPPAVPTAPNGPPNLDGLAIGVVFGGANSEHAVSVASARGVIPALRAAGATVRALGVDRRGIWHTVDDADDLATVSPASALPPPMTRGTVRIPGGVGPAPHHLTGLDLVFPVIHGRGGEDGTLQGLLELAGMPYVGCGVLSSALAMDKKATVRMLRAGGLPVINTTSVDAAGDLPGILAGLAFPVFVKPNRAGSSVGASRVEHAGELPGALATALDEDTTALIQPLARGEEVSIGVLQRRDGSIQASGPSRLVLGGADTFFSYDGKYAGGQTHLQIPADVPKALVARLQELAIAAFAELDCTGLARVDFFVDQSVSPAVILINELNTMPGIGARSHYPRLWQAAGVGYADLLGELVHGALARAVLGHR